MQLLGRAKFLMEDENPKGKVMFLKRGEFPRNFAPRECDILGGAKFLGHRITASVYRPLILHRDVQIPHILFLHIFAHLQANK